MFIYGNGGAAGERKGDGDGDGDGMEAEMEAEMRDGDVGRRRETGDGRRETD